MQALDDLKQDINTLIETATSSIEQLIEQAKNNMSAAAGAAQAAGTDLSDVFTSQLMQLSQQVRSATDNLKQRVSTLNGGSSGSSGSSSPAASGTGLDGSSSSTSTAASAPAAATIGPDSFKAAG